MTYNILQSKVDTLEMVLRIWTNENLEITEKLDHPNTKFVSIGIFLCPPEH